jgi:filamentous hemagglutinin family protein
MRARWYQKSCVALALAVLLSMAPGGALSPIDALAGQIVVDNTFGHGGTLSGPNFMIGAGLGMQVGSNLFQSFSTFNLDKGGLATFTAPGSVHNILARVTGGSPSTIDGTIATRLDTNAATPHPADFYLINPAGIVFGPDAKLDIGGSFIVSTADYTQLADGTRFTSSLSPPQALLTTAAPAAFGFLASHPTGISINGAQLTVPTGKSVLVAGGSLSVGSSGSVTASAGQIDVVAIASPAMVSFDPASLLPGPVTVAAMGPMTLTNDSQLSADGSGAGMIAIECGNLSLSGGSSIHADTVGTGTGRGITINATGLVALNGTDNSGNDSSLRAGVAAGASGAGGNIAIQASGLSLENGASVSTTTLGLGSGGNIVANISGQLTLSGAANVGYNGVSASGNQSGVYADSGVFKDFMLPIAGGHAGSITVSTGRIEVLGGAQISSQTFTNGGGGNVAVKTVNDTVVSGTDRTLSSDITTETAGIGNGGNISIASDSLQITDGGEITSGTGNSTGEGGAVTVDVPGQILMSGTGIVDGSRTNSAIFTGSISYVTSGADAGPITVSAGSLTLLGGAALYTETYGIGSGSQIDMNIAGRVNISGKNPGEGFEGQSGIYTASEQGGSIYNGVHGDAGSITLIGGFVRMEGAQIKSSSFHSNAGAVSISSRSNLSLADSTVTVAAHGDGGDISLSAAKHLFVQQSIISGHAGKNGGRVSLGAPLVAIGASTIDGLSKRRPVRVNISGNQRFISDTQILTDLPIMIPEVDLAGSLAPLRLSLTTSVGLEPQCGADLGENQSSFVMPGRGGAPAEPGGWLPEMQLILRP